MKTHIVLIEKKHTASLVSMLLGLLMNSAGCTSSGSGGVGAAGGESGSGGSTSAMGGVSGMGGMGGNGGAMGGMGGNGGVMGGMGGMGGVPCMPIDDGDFCTDDLCVNDIAVHTNATLGTSCGANLVCNGSGACLLVPGQTCVSDSNCESGTCLDGVCIANTGHWCANGSQCPSHICSNSVCVMPQALNGPLDWMTVLEFTSFSSGAQLNLLAVSGLDNGGLAFAGEVPFSYTDIKLGGVPIPNCQASKIVFTGSLDGAGVLGPISLDKCFVAEPDIDVFRVQGGFGYSGKYSIKSHTGYDCDFYLGKWAPPAWATSGPNRDVVGNDSGAIAAIVGNHQWPDGCAYWSSERLVKFDPSGVKVFDVPVPQGFEQMIALGSAGEFYTRTYQAQAIIIKKWDAAANLQWSTAALPYTSAFDVDTLGNVLLAFAFNGTIDLGAGPMIATGIKDLGLAKLDPNGTVVWQKHFGSVGFELKTIGITHTGVLDPVVHGSIVGSTDLGDGPLQRTAFFAKFDASGNVLWHVDFDGLSVFPLFLHGNAAGEVFLGSESFLLDFGWGPPLAGKQGIIAAKYGP